MVVAQVTVLACSRALLRAGRRMPISTAMMPITTSSSTRVNARTRLQVVLFVLVLIAMTASSAVSRSRERISLLLPPEQVVHGAEYRGQNQSDKRFPLRSSGRLFRNYGGPPRV